MIDPVVVTGLGAVCSLGLGVEPFWRGLLAGTQTVRPHPRLTTLGLGDFPLAMVPLPESQDPDDAPRALLFAELAAAEALADAGFASSPPRLGLCIGTTLGEKTPFIAQLRGKPPAAGVPFGPAAPARQLAMRYAARRVRAVSAACASSNVALGVGLGWLRSGLCDVVLCGGVDALQEFVISGFAALRAQSPSPCRPFDADRSGLNLGEGAAFLVLEHQSQARARGQRTRARLVGVGLGCDANHMTGPDRTGRGAARAMQAALVDAELSAADIDFVSAHGTATLFNDQMESQALGTLLGERVGEVPVNSIKGSIGHTLGAAGALEAVMAVRVLESQLIPPTAGHEKRDEGIRLDVVAGAARSARVRTILSTSSGFGGLNAAIVLGAAADEGSR